MLATAVPPVACHKWHLTANIIYKTLLVALHDKIFLGTVTLNVAITLSLFFSSESMLLDQYVCLAHRKRSTTRFSGESDLITETLPTNQTSDGNLEKLFPPISH
jgi:hypothetical protein